MKIDSAFLKGPLKDATADKESFVPSASSEGESGGSKRRRPDDVSDPKANNNNNDNNNLSANAGRAGERLTGFEASPPPVQLSSISSSSSPSATSASTSPSLDRGPKNVVPGETRVG